MKKKEFAQMYDGAIRRVAIANNVEMGVARDMLIYEAKVAAGVHQKRRYIPGSRRYGPERGIC